MRAQGIFSPWARLLIAVTGSKIKNDSVTTDLAGPDTYAYVYAKTSENSVIFESDEDDLDGDPDFLNASTLEEDRELSCADASQDAADGNLDFHYNG